MGAYIEGRGVQEEVRAASEHLFIAVDDFGECLQGITRARRVEYPI